MTEHESPHPLETAHAAHTAGVAQFQAGRYAAALADFDKALPPYRKHAIPTDLAMCLMNRGVCLRLLGRTAEALATYVEAVPLFHQHALPADLADCLMNRATCLLELGRTGEALQAYDEALPLARQHGLSADLAQSLMNRGICLLGLGRTPEALAAIDEALPLYRQYGLPADLAMCLMNRAICLEGLGRRGEALEAYDEALSLAHRHALPGNLALCVMNRATCLLGLGRTAEALAAIDEALTLFRQHALPADLASCLMNRAICLLDLGRTEEALATFDEALPLARQHGLPADFAMCLMNRAICLVDLERPGEALAAYDEALPLFQQHALSADLAKCLVNRAVSLRVLGRSLEALAAYDEALPLARQHALPTDLAMCLTNRSACLRDLGRPEEALAAFDEALPLARQHAKSADIAKCLINRAICLLDLGRPEEALAAFDEALPLARQHAKSADIAKCLINRAICLLDLGRPEEALAAFDEALPLARQYSLPADLAQCLMNRAACLLHLERPEEALVANDEALPLARQHARPADYAIHLVNRTVCLLHLRRPDEALAANDEALPLARLHARSADFARSLMNRAFCLDDLGRHEEALAASDAAFAAEDRATTSLQDLSNRTRAREQTVGRYRRVTGIALDLKQPERAWTYVQRAKGRTLTDLLAARADLTALDRQELLLVQQQQAGLVDPETYAAALTRIGDQRQAQRTARLGTDPRAPLGLDRVVATLQPGEVLLDAFTAMDDGSAFLFLIRPGQTAVSWVDAVDGEILTALAANWDTGHALWRDVASSTDPAILARRQYFMDSAAAIQHNVLSHLGKLIFAPVLAQLDETVTTLIVSPDGVLHRLPLAAVTVPDARGNQIPLIDRIDLQLVPTASSLAILRGPHGPRLTWPAALLAAAPFATDGDDDPSRDGDRAGRSLYAPRDLLREGAIHNPLAHSGPEIRAVAEQLRNAGGADPDIYTRDATRARLEERLPVAHMLHLATHGGALEADETVLDYRIFLADNTELRVRELYEGQVTLKDVFLVNLSACSLGEVVLQGAEASGFVQAFLQAGAGVVLAPLWAVDDRATKELMVRFYEELTAADRPTVAQAWRRATQRLRQETGYTHPIYWAGFLPSGDASLRLTA